MWLGIPDTITVEQINVNSLNSKDKIDQVIHYINKRHSDIFILIDTRTSIEMESYLNTVWNGHILYNSAHNGSRGIAILFKKRLRIEQLTHKIEIVGNLSYVFFKLQSQTFTLAALYGPSDSDDSDFFSKHVFEEENFPNSDHIIFPETGIQF